MISMALKIAANVLVIGSLVSFMLSTFFVFERKSRRSNFLFRAFQLLSSVFYIFGPYELMISNLNDFRYLILSLIQGLCIFLFWQNARLVKKNRFGFIFSSDTPSVLIKTGLYRYIRNPYYSIYILSYASLSFVLNSPILIANSAAIFLIYYTAARLEEKKFMASPLSDEYGEYVSNTGRFFPKIFKNKFTR